MATRFTVIVFGYNSVQVQIPSSLGTFIDSYRIIQYHDIWFKWSFTYAFKNNKAFVTTNYDLVHRDDQHHWR